MTDDKNIRFVVKQYLRNRDYKKAFEYLDSYSSDEKISSKILSNKSKYFSLQKEFQGKKIDNRKYFYGVSKVVMEMLDIVDEIEGKSDDDWDFIDELNSSLKFNLLEEQIDPSNQQNVEQNDYSNKAFSDEEIKKEELKLKEIIRDLISQLHKYEELELLSEADEQKKKYHDIKEGINSQILSYSKRLKELIPEKND